MVNATIKESGWSDNEYFLNIKDENGYSIHFVASNDKEMLEEVLAKYMARRGYNGDTPEALHMFQLWRTLQKRYK